MGTANGIQRLRFDFKTEQDLAPNFWKKWQII